MIYEYLCTVCKTRHTAERTIRERNNGPMCCGQQTEKRIFTAVKPSETWGGWTMGYKCVATGKEITSPAQRKQVMKENGLADARDFPAPDWDKLEQDRKEVHESAAQPLPADLQEAIKREGLDHIV